MSDEYKAHIGSNLEGSFERTEFNNDTYADLNSLLADLSNLVGFINSLQDEIEKSLSTIAIQVDKFDSHMMDALDGEWPEELGDPPERISYRYYKTLRLSNTSSSDYLQERFEQALRDVKGSADLDLMILLDITKGEALQIQNFITRHVGNVHDSSEKRLLELFQDWIQSAVTNVKEINTYARTKQQEQLTQRDLETISRPEARRGQAVFKVKLNTTNDLILKDLDYIKRNFSESSSVFFDRFLGPAMDQRLKSSRQIVGKPQSSINDELLLSKEILDDNLRNALSDQVRRENIYHNKMAELRQNIVARDGYRELIKSLSKKGKNIPTSGPGIVVDAQDSEDELILFQRLDQTDPLTRVIRSIDNLQIDGSLDSSHSSLKDLDKGNPHPQYLLKEGGFVSGNITMPDSVRVGGIVPSKHAHTGEDGSARVHGSNIEGGTLGIELIDLNEKPPTPILLQIDEYDPDIIPPGMAVIDTNMSWEGFDEDTFEVQIVRVGKKAEQIAESAEGFLWVVSQSIEDNDYYIYQIDADDGTVVGAIPSPTSTPEGLDFIPHFGEPMLWLTDKQNATIYSINAITGEVVNSFDVSTVTISPTGIFKESGTTWLSSADGKIYELDENHQVIREF